MAASLPTFIQGDGLRLQAWSQDGPAGREVRRALVLRNLPYLREWLPWAALEPLSPQEEEEQLLRWESSRLEGREAFYAILLTPGEQAVGGFGIHGRFADGGYEMGSWVDHQATRQGISTRANLLAADWLLGVRRVPYVEVHYDPAHLASSKIALKLGFQLVGEVPEPVRAPGHTGTQVVWRREA